MSQTEIEEIVSEFRKSVYDISDEAVTDVLKLCRRKIEIAGQQEDYMKLLLPDELKNYCFRMVINIVSFARTAEKECGECAVCVS